MTATLPVIDPARAKAYFDDKLAFTTGPIELSEWQKSDANINVIDVRDAEDFEKSHIPGAISLPKDKWATLEGLSKDKTNVIYCYSQQCHLGAKACREFASKGYPVMELEGGFAVWKEYDLEIDRPPLDRRVKQSAEKLFHKSH